MTGSPPSGDHGEQYWYLGAPPSATALGAGKRIGFLLLTRVVVGVVAVVFLGAAGCMRVADKARELGRVVARRKPRRAAS